MGKPSLKSRKTSWNRKKNRKIKLIKTLKSREEELSDLQIQFLDYKKLTIAAGERVHNEIEKCSRENDNLVKWLNLYDKQIKHYEKETYDLNLRLYFSQQPQPQPKSQQQPEPQPQPQPKPSSPTFKCMADYFEYANNQK